MTNELFNSWEKLWLPPERLPLSQWAEKNLVLSPEYGPRSGPVKLYPFQKEIFDSFTDPSVSEIALACGTQLTKTLFIQAVIAYIISEAPGPTLLIEYKEDDAKKFSKQRLGPMLRDCPILHGKVNTDSKTGQDTLTSKDFPGGYLMLVGSGSASNVAQRTIRFLLCDEVDLYESIDRVGDPISLARKRVVNFGSQGKVVLACSPTSESGRIWQAYENSDMRQPWVPCPLCGTFQVLDWTHVEWDNTLPVERRAASARYECQHCKARWNDAQRWAACSQLEWRAQRPFVGKAGFWISQLYSPWSTLSSLVDEYLVKKHSHNREEIRTFYNTALAQPWRESGQAPQENLLFAQREEYNAEVPQRCLFLTAGVDVQQDRLEVEVVGWGRDGESYSIAYETIEALDSNGNRLSVQSAQVWAQLDTLLKRQWKHESGSTMQIWAMAIDTGSLPQPVYQFAWMHPQPAYATTGNNIRVHAYATVIPVKGSASDDKVISSVSSEDAARKRRGLKIVGVGTNMVKTQLFDSLRFIKPGKEAVPNSCHFPNEYSLDCFKGLCSEERIVTDTGKIHFQKKNAQRNEVLDCRVYAIAAAVVCGLDKMQEHHWQGLEERLKYAAPVLPHAPAQRPTRKIRGQF